MSRRLSTLALALLAPAAAAAEEISFEEIPPVNGNLPALSEEYADRGVHFVGTDDGAVWSGLSAGDPGGWGLEGTNGSAFVGFNGASYALRAFFDAPVRDVRLDAARSLGSRPGDGIVLRGYRGGQMVEELSMVLGDVNAWSTMALAQEVDGIEWVGFGAGTRRHPYGVDNLRWTAEAPAIAAEVDVKPDSARNRVNPFARGVVPVALLGSELLRVDEIDLDSLAFGPLGARAVHAHVEDVDGDGHPDLVSHHRVAETGIGCGDVEACLAGETLGGTPFAGCDAVSTVPSCLRAARPPARAGGGPKR
jgi:hypothetical protein